MKTAIIGGTFHALHNGHKEYIRTAFEYADFVYIMITTSKYARKEYKVKNINERSIQLIDYLNENNFKDFMIVPMNSGEDLSDIIMKNEITVAIITPEYYKKIRYYNKLRIMKNMRSFLIIVMEKILLKRNELSSTSLEKKHLTTEQN